MDSGFQDKVFMVTGAASGIGKNISVDLSTAGAIVILLDKHEINLKKTFDEIENTGGHCLPLMVDLTKENECRQAIEQIANTYKRIDGLVNNAGLNDGVSIESGSSEKFRQSLDINVGHYERIVRLSLPYLKISKGCVLNICSKIAVTGQGRSSGYAAANGARLALTTYWSEKFNEFGIRVNGIIVSECWTPQYEWWIGQMPDGEQKRNEIESKIPFQARMTTTREIADTALFLLSAGAADFNGQLFYVDGGYVHLDRAAVFNKPHGNP